MNPKRPVFVDELIKEIKCDVYDGHLALGIYATDASIYQIAPLAVISAKDEEDVRVCLSIAMKHHIPILARGGGTSLAGQAVAEAIVIDFSKYMNKILSFDN